MNINLDHLEEFGFATIPGFMEQSLTGRLRSHMDRLLPPPEEAEGKPQSLRHPIPGNIMGEILNRQGLLDLGRRLLDANQLMLLEQVLIRTCACGKSGPRSWHIDWAFYPSEYESRPRQTYFHCVHALNTVKSGGGAFMVVPGSHKLTYAASAKMTTEEELKQLKADPIEVAGIDTSEAIEVLPDEGDLIVFNPMALHSASYNNDRDPRYAYFCSFFDASATRLRAGLDARQHRSRFPESLREALPAELQSMLDA